jgi:hypothetical protein
VGALLAGRNVVSVEIDPDQTRVAVGRITSLGARLMNPDEMVWNEDSSAPVTALHRWSPIRGRRRVETKAVGIWLEPVRKMAGIVPQPTKDQLEAFKIYEEAQEKFKEQQKSKEKKHKAKEDRMDKSMKNKGISKKSIRPKMHDLTQEKVDDDEDEGDASSRESSAKEDGDDEEDDGDDDEEDDGEKSSKGDSQSQSSSSSNPFETDKELHDFNAFAGGGAPSVPSVVAVAGDKRKIDCDKGDEPKRPRLERSPSPNGQVSEGKNTADLEGDGVVLVEDKVGDEIDKAVEELF